MRTGSELLEHTAEVKLRLLAPSFGELVAEAGRAVARIELAGELPAPTGPWRELEIHSSDREALLVDWLNELIFLAETERWVATDFEVRNATDTELSVRARGATVETAPARIKAATFHGLEIVPVAGGLATEVIFDV